jgi:hypothetical protein
LRKKVVRMCLTSAFIVQPAHRRGRGFATSIKSLPRVPSCTAEIASRRAVLGAARGGLAVHDRGSHCPETTLQRPVVGVGVSRACDEAEARSGRIEARIGLRMMPTFPRSPLSFRTASFPQYGCKAGFQAVPS